MRKLLFVLACIHLSTSAFASAPKPTKEDSRLLKKFPKLFSRSAGKLSLSMEGGKAARVFTDHTATSESSDYLEHHLYSYHPAHHVAVVERIEGEEGDYVFVSLKTGTETAVLQRPHWNKPGDFFASVNEGELADDKNGLQLGHCDGKECKLLLEKDGRYSQPKWTGPSRFRATNRVPAADGGEGLVLKVRCTVNRKTVSATCVP
jgi:hypothetical protein